MKAASTNTPDTVHLVDDAGNTDTGEAGADCAVTDDISVAE
ncbi:hypothetical protein JCM19237_6359 [Photobacterium aphoticum]|uniref:Uncharacterized protein n=1 Tax=Photobacterium aphoticum TaxID=754436 RepID=A0A090QK08_9GAMM|nr:hypothetical protein JCM19237_6359 [Photobacterium aphoticum]